MLNGRYQIRAKPPSHGVKINSSKEPKRKPKLYYLQDRSAHVLGIFSTSEQFVHSYISQGEATGTISEDIEARTVNLSQENLDRLVLLLRTAHNKTTDDLKNKPVPFFYDLIAIVNNDEKWDEWKREYKK